jgi:hypothetical protein
MTEKSRNQRWASGSMAAMLVLLAAVWSCNTLAASPAKKEIKPQAFPTPDAAVQALVDAARKNSDPALLAIYGSSGEDLIHSGDDVQDAQRRAKFLEEYDAAHSVVLKYEDEAELVIGKDHWPFPVPIVKVGKKWSFDAEGGREEILSRRIGADELSTMNVLEAYVQAQREYYAVDHDLDEVPEYAQRVVSTKGLRDGLYWEAGEGEDPSPMGPLMAGAAAEGYDAEGLKAVPYHGYHFKVLKAQGPDAVGGAFSYVVGENMVAGYAMAAWPAEYGNSGIMTFLVNANGIIYQKDLGEKTDEIESAMNQYNPDATWSRAQ